ncbi:hypothetical protein F0U44_21100 [Nocardioides humilatus]|uniref:Uncharacterized protein n=1 Tax=Nocardioides humilatus TaxID=2607660 RepID=A0A5B1L498_9ACTN|nr:hypothetical protein [Nocardioides humilatus]KAA1415483.1 hypothetical protein F0U44_21100 [Nocardioides humilatus]
MFDKLKLAAQAMSPANIKRGIELSRQSMANGGRLTEEQMAGWTPEQRQQYEASMAQAQANMAAMADKMIADEMARRVVHGPAGDWLYGPLPDREGLTDLSMLGHWQSAQAGFLDTLRNPFGRKAPPPPPPRPPVSADRDQQLAAERAVRDEARTPYLAPHRIPVVRTRITTNPKSHVKDLAGWLGAAGLSARPDLVYGVYRVPDHITGGFGIRKASVVEWEVVHAAQPGMPPSPPAFVAGFSARDRWAARRPGEPSILDEDLGLDYLRAAGLGPERCLGVARLVDVDATSGDSESGGTYVMVGVTGLVVFHPVEHGGGAHAQLQSQRPLQVLPAPDVHIAVLNWSDVRRVVNPRPDHRIIVPSPFPHLPATGGELLEAYLGIVGVRPQDCYSAQVTCDQPMNILGGGQFVTTTSTESEPAADGQSRPRFRGGSRIVVAYRDSADYVEGRERWAAYQREALRTTLENRVAVREPVEKQSKLDRGVLGAVLKVADVVDTVVTGEAVDEPFKGLPTHRYCWPPVQ